MSKESPLKMNQSMDAHEKVTMPREMFTGGEREGNNYEKFAKEEEAHQHKNMRKMGLHERSPG